MVEKVYEKIASLVTARLNCLEKGNQEWAKRHQGELHHIERNVLPHGSGIDNGVKIDLDKSTTQRLVLTFGYHFMNEAGFYDGWLEYTAIITPCLLNGINVRITGRDRNQIKDYLYEMFSHTLRENYKQPAESKTA